MLTLQTLGVILFWQVKPLLSKIFSFDQIYGPVPEAVFEVGLEIVFEVVLEFVLEGVLEVVLEVVLEIVLEVVLEVVLLKLSLSFLVKSCF